MSNRLSDVMEDYLDDLLVPALPRASANPAVPTDLAEAAQPAEVPPLALMEFVYANQLYAAPMVQIAKVFPFQSPYGIPGAITHRSGVISFGKEHYKLVDASRQLAASGKQKRVTLEPPISEVIISLRDSDMAIKCQKILGTRQLLTAEYRLFADDLRTIPWLMGTVTQNMCPIIDLLALETAIFQD